ncbi:hypothetical protein ACFLSE_04830 [Bacteroidota bacterium]
MRKNIFKTLVIFTIALLSGCASVYKPINPPTIKYTSHVLKDGISLSYKYDVLNEKGNRKYARREDVKSLKIISLKITNNTDSTIAIGKDVAFYCGSNQLFPLEPIVVKHSIKQAAPSYLLYLLLTPLKLFVTKTTATSVTTETYPIGYVLGPTLALGNMAVAGTANTNLLNELNTYNILNQNIEKGETVYGIIGLKDLSYNTISIRKIGSINENEQDILVSLQEIEQQITNPQESYIDKSKQDLYKTDTSISYEIYYQYILNRSNNLKIEEGEIFQDNYENGNIKSIGIKAKQKVETEDDDLYYSINRYYKVGTWRYFYDNGQLRLLIDYDLSENKDGRYLEYDSEGNLILEKKYKAEKQ